MSSDDRLDRLLLQSQLIAKQERLRTKKARQGELSKQKHKERAAKCESAIFDFRDQQTDWIGEVPEAPTFRPSREEFADPLAYIASIQSKAAKYGICKIVPPVGAALPASLAIKHNLANPVDNKPYRFTTRQQDVTDTVWASFENILLFSEGSKLVSVTEFERAADDFARRRFNTAGQLPQHMVEAEYWRTRSEPESTWVEYGNDVEGSGFCKAGRDARDPLGKTDWNLQVLPKSPASVLRLLDADIPGVTSPMLYIGMLFATFCWHVEDNYLYSINFQHLGAAKTWYGVPAADADKLEDTVMERIYVKALAELKSRERCPPDVLRRTAISTLLNKTTMFSPRVLLDAGVHVSRVIQNPGEFVVTFPRGYHAGFSNGFCIGEAANFALGNWFTYAADVRARYQGLRHPPVVPTETLLVGEALALRDRLKSEGPAPRGSALAVTTAVVQQEFVRHMQQCHLLRAKLHDGGALCQACVEGGENVVCTSCHDGCCVALVHDAHGAAVWCLKCASTISIGPTLTVHVTRRMGELEDLARQFEAALAAEPMLEGGLGTDGLSAEVAAGPLPHFEWRTDLLLPAASAAELEPVSPADAAVLEQWESQLAAAAASKATRDAAAPEAAASPGSAGLPSPGAVPGPGSGNAGGRGAIVSPAAGQVPSHAMHGGGYVEGGFATPGQRAAETVGATAGYGLAGKRELEQPAQQEAKRLRWDSSDGAEEEEDDTSEELDTGGQPLMVIHTSFVDVSMGAAGAPLMRQRCICCKVGATRDDWDTYLLAEEVLDAMGCLTPGRPRQSLLRFFRRVAAKSAAVMLPAAAVPKRAWVDGNAAEQRHVLTAEDVILMAWAAPEPARSRLSAFASGIWSRLPSVAPSEHLTALIKLDLRYSSQTNVANLDTRMDGATDSPDGSASTSFCTGQEPGPQPPPQYQLQAHQRDHQQSQHGVSAAANLQENTSAMQSAVRLPRCGSAFVDSIFGPEQLPDEQRTMLKDLLNEGISSNSYRTIISQQMRKLPPERVQVMQAVLAALIQCEYEVQQPGQVSARWHQAT